MPCSPHTIYQRLGTGVPGWSRVEPSFPAQQSDWETNNNTVVFALGKPFAERTQVGFWGAREPEEAGRCSQGKERGLKKKKNHPCRKITSFWIIGCSLAFSRFGNYYFSADPQTQANLKANALLLSHLIFHWQSEGTGPSDLLGPIYPKNRDSFCFVFWLRLWHVEVWGPEIETSPQKLPKPLQWQCQILNLLHHMGTPKIWRFWLCDSLVAPKGLASFLPLVTYFPAAWVRSLELIWMMDDFSK